MQKMRRKSFFDTRFENDVKENSSAYLPDLPSPHGVDGLVLSTFAVAEQRIFENRGWRLEICIVTGGIPFLEISSSSVYEMKLVKTL